MYFYFTVFLVIFSSAVQATSDSEFLSRVKGSNLGIKGLESSLESAKVQKGHLGRSFLPELTLELGHERFQTGRYRTLGNPYGFLEARLNLFRGGKDKIQDRIQDLGASSAELAVSQRMRLELKKARQIKWKIVYNENLVKILENEKRENARIKVQAERRARSGVSAQSDNLEFIIYETELVEQIVSLKHENRILRLKLLPILGLKPTDRIDLPEIFLHEHDEELFSEEFDSKKHPVIAAAKNAYEIYELQKQADERWWAPRLDVYGGYYMYTLRDRDYLSQSLRDDRVIGARLVFEIFDGLKSKTQAVANHYKAEAQRRQGLYQGEIIKTQSEALKEEMLHIHEVMHLIENRTKKSKDYLKITLSEYDRGVKNSPDALLALQRYFRNEKEYLEKLKDYQLIKAELLELRGL